MAQNNEILSWLKTGKTLTPLDALNYFGCFRLSARIYDLKEDGWPIQCDLRMTSSGKVVGHYILVNDKDQWPER